MSLFKKTPGRHFTHKQTRFLALMCGGMALLLLVALFVGGGAHTLSKLASSVSPGSQTACTFFGTNCGGTLIVQSCLVLADGYDADKAVVAGTGVTLSWQFAGGSGHGDAIFTNYDPANDQYNFALSPVLGSTNSAGSIAVYPTQTTTYVFSANYHHHSDAGIDNQNNPYAATDSYGEACSESSNLPGGANYIQPFPDHYVRTIYVTAPAPPSLSLTANPNPISQGQNTYLTFTATGGTGIDSCLLGGGQFGGGVPVGTSGVAGPISPYPSTQYWYDCHDPYNTWAPPAFVTVNVGASVQADFAASPSTVTVGQSATLLYYAQSTDPPTACHINGPGNIGTLVDVPTCTIAQNKSYTTPVYTTPGTYDYYFYYYRNGWVYVKPAYVTVTAAPLACPNGSGNAGSCTACNSGYVLSGGNCLLTPTDICTDIVGTQPTTPTGCQVPVPNPGSCVPSGYTYNGTQCVVTALPISIGSFSASPTRVRKNVATNITFSYLVTNPGASCTISGPAGFTPLTINPVNAVAGIRTASVTLPQASYFTLTCGAVSAQTRVNLIPVTQEI